MSKPRLLWTDNSVYVDTRLGSPPVQTINGLQKIIDKTVTHLFDRYFDNQLLSFSSIKPGDTVIACYPEHSRDEDRGYDSILSTIGDTRGIVWHAFDCGVTTPSRQEQGNLWLTTPAWMWILESCIYSNRYAYRTYQPPNATNRKNFFLSLMNQQRYFRDVIWDQTNQYHNCSLRSYFEKGYTLEGDIIEVHKNHRGAAHDKHMVPFWYDSTQFSLVVESYHDPIWKSVLKFNSTAPTDTFISEKSYKPFAFFHPALYIGTSNTISFLKSQGFETWDHVIDEMYDRETESNRRMFLAFKQLELLYLRYQSGEILFQDAISQEKLEHNHHRFYDADVIDQIFFREFVEPIYNFIETR